MPRLRAVLGFLVGALLFALSSPATWSIVVVDLVTGEVAVGIATCLTGFDLRPNTVVVVPGYGVAAAQSFVGPLSLRQLIRQGLLNGDAAAQILAALAAADPGHQGRQYGIVALTGGEVTFTGTSAGAWAGGVVGQSGSLRYAIQGNVLTGQPVVQAAEQALIGTVGSLPERLMAAMEAARSMGGDGRCSCSPGGPTGCGSPPPSFTKSAHIALMIVSRPSDLDAACTGTLGCGAGDYWLDLNVAGQQASAPDPVLQLQGLFASWQAQQIGRPDHYQSTVTMNAPSLRADGVGVVTGTVWLRDAVGNVLGNSLPLAVELHASSTVDDVVVGAAVPQANGSYTFSLQSGFQAGQVVLDVSVVDAVGRVGLWPRPSIVVDDLFGPCGAGAIPDGAGGQLAALRVTGGSERDRVVTVGYGEPFTLALDAPGGATGGPVGLFALWGHVGVPAAGSQVPLGLTQGELCFLPAPFGASPTVLIADSFGLGGAVLAGPAPWQLPIPGVSALLDVALQGVMAVDPTATFAATNAVYLRIVPLPPPNILSVAPPAPTPGQLVTVSGNGFDPGMVATIAGQQVPVVFLSPVQVWLNMPNGVPCDAPLLFANPGGLVGASTINRTPVVNTTSITSGPAAGGGNFVVVGSALFGTTVTFNGTPMSIATQFDNLIVGTLPPGTPGPAVVLVQNPNGCVVQVPFTYL